MPNPPKLPEAKTMTEIAQALGISKTTVSRAISGKGRVGAETRAKVFEYLSRYGCETGALARRQQEGGTHNIGIVIPNDFIRLDLPFLRRCLGGVCRMAAQRGYDVLLCYVSDDDLSQLERQLEARKVDGVILSRSVTDDPALARLQQSGIPYTVIGHPEDTEILQQDNDHVGGAAELTRLLVGKGMTRIAYMGADVNYTVNKDRLKGYLQGLEEMGQTPNRDLIFTNINNEEQRVDALAELLERQPECIVCADDTLAFNTLKDLRRAGICVPRDIRVASLFDSDMLLNVTPSVSAVNFDSEVLGITACRALLDSMAGKEVPRRQVHGYEVILRETTK